MDSKNSRKSKRGQGTAGSAPTGKKSQNLLSTKSKVKKSVKKKGDVKEEKVEAEVMMLDAESGEVGKTDLCAGGGESVVLKEINEAIDTETGSASAGDIQEVVLPQEQEGQSHVAETEQSSDIQDTPSAEPLNDLDTKAETVTHQESVVEDVEPEVFEADTTEAPDPEISAIPAAQPTSVTEQLEAMRLDPNAFSPESRDDSSCADDLTPVNETPADHNLLTTSVTSVRIQSDKEDESSSTEVWWTAREEFGAGSDEGSLRATSALSLDEISDGLMDSILSPAASHKARSVSPCSPLLGHSPPAVAPPGGFEFSHLQFTNGAPVEKRDATTLTDIVTLPSPINGHSNQLPEKVGLAESPTSEVKGRKSESGHGHGRRGSIVRGQSVCEEFTTEDSSIVDYLVDVQDGAEARLAARRQARAEAREIRMKELEKQQKESEDNADRHYDMQQSTDVVNRAAFRVALGNHRPASHTHSLGSTSYHSSRRSSEESSEDGHMSMRDMRHELKELEDKFRKSMVQNAQLDNEKSALTYHVELLKDKIEDLEEALSQITRDLRDKSRDCEQLKRVTEELRANITEELAFLKYQLQDREQLIKEYGLVVVENEVEVDVGNGERETKLKRTLVTQETADVLSTLGEGSLDVRLKRVLEEKNELMDELRRLKLDLEEEQSLNSKGHHNHVTNHINGPDSDHSEIHREVSKQMADYKYKIQKYEQEILALQANVSRLDGQVNRYRTAAEEAETREDDLKVEKRKLQRELREAQSRLDEVETTNSHLQKRLDKLKTAKSNLLKDL